jgi:Calcium binding
MAKQGRKEDPEREERISDEVVVDAYGPEERSMGWYYYVAETIEFPFKAVCTSKEKRSPLKLKDNVEVKGIASVDDCEHAIYVLIDWDGEELAVPLSQLTPAKGVDAATKEVVADWHYWVEMGYEY